MLQSRDLASQVEKIGVCFFTLDARRQMALNLARLSRRQLAVNQRRNLFCKTAIHINSLIQP